MNQNLITPLECWWNKEQNMLETRTVSYKGLSVGSSSGINNVYGFTGDLAYGRNSWRKVN